MYLSPLINSPKNKFSFLIPIPFKTLNMWSSTDSLYRFSILKSKNFIPNKL